MKTLFTFLLIACSIVVFGQTEFKNGVNTIVFSSLESDSSWNDTNSTFKFNRDVTGWGAQITWDSVFSGTGIVIPEISNDLQEWYLYPGMDTITVTDTSGAAIWYDDGFTWLRGRWRFVNSDTLIHGTITITTLVKTIK